MILCTHEQRHHPRSQCAHTHRQGDGLVGEMLPQCLGHRVEAAHAVIAERQLVHCVAHSIESLHGGFLRPSKQQQLAVQAELQGARRFRQQIPNKVAFAQSLDRSKLARHDQGHAGVRHTYTFKVLHGECIRSVDI